jgi:hypothetical protein
MEGQSKPQAKPLLRRQKGWKGFVQSYNNYIENGSYDDVKWGCGTKLPKSINKTPMGKVIIKF